MIPDPPPSVDAPYPISSNTRFRAFRKLMLKTVGPRACANTDIITLQERGQTQLIRALLTTSKQDQDSSSLFHVVYQYV